MTYGFFDKEEGVLARHNGQLLTHLQVLTQPLIGSIYRAQLGKRLDFLSANEVDLGGQKALIFDQDRRPARPGQILVQVKGQAYDGKRLRLTEKISLQGQYVVIDPYSDQVNISKKIRDVQVRASFTDLFKEVKYGVIVRTGALGSEGEAREEYKGLEEIMDRVLALKDFKPCPQLIYQPEPGFGVFFQGASQVFTNDPGLARSRDGQDLPIDFQPSFSYLDDPVLAQAYYASQQRELDIAGAGLVFDELEALTVVDVNSGSVKAGSSKEGNAHHVNLLVLDSLLSQLVARGIGGIVLVDFIRARPQQMADLLREIRARVQEFSINIKGLSLTQSGLVEMVLARN